MTDYGCFGGFIIKKDIMISILRVMPEVYWCKLKLNTKIRTLMKSLHLDLPVDQLAIMGRIESLKERPVKFQYICQSGDLDVIKRFSYGKNIHREYGWIEYENTDLSSVLFNIIKNRDEEFDVNLLLKFLPTEPATNVSSMHDKFDDALVGACESGNIQVVKYIYENYFIKSTIEISPFELEKAYKATCRSGSIEILNFLISKGLKITVSIAENCGQVKFVEYLKTIV